MFRINVQCLNAPLNGHFQASPKLKASYLSLGHSVFFRLLPRDGQQVLETPSPAQRGKQNALSSFCSLVQNIYRVGQTPILSTRNLWSRSAIGRGEQWNSGTSEEQGEITFVWARGRIGWSFQEVVFERDLEKRHQFICIEIWRAFQEEFESCVPLPYHDQLVGKKNGRFLNICYDTM